jgi:cytochrome P450
VIDLASPETYANGIPHDVFRDLRANAPVSWQAETKGPGFWAVTRHADIVHVLRTPALFSSHRAGARLEDLPPEFLEKIRENMMNSDPPHHTKLRKLTNHVFAPKRVGLLEERVSAYVKTLVDNIIDRGACDFATDVAGSLPLFVICEILGVPEQDRAHLYDLTNRMFASISEDRVIAMKASMAAANEMRAYASELAARRRTQTRTTPSENLVDDLLEAEIDGEKLTDSQFQGFFMLLFNAGADTTRSVLCYGLDTLMRHPQALAQVQADPSMIAGAVEEMLRYETVVIQFRRTATQDTELAGTKIKEGDKVVVFFPSANRDEALFANPDTFDITRSPNHHLAFGHGTHFCLGAPLARMEANHLFRELLSRVHRIEPNGPMVTGKTNFVRSVHNLPIAFSRR